MADKKLTFTEYEIQNLCYKQRIVGRKDGVNEAIVAMRKVGGYTDSGWDSIEERVRQETGVKSDD